MSSTLGYPTCAVAIRPWDGSVYKLGFPRWLVVQGPESACDAPLRRTTREVVGGGARFSRRRLHTYFFNCALLYALKKICYKNQLFRDQWVGAQRVASRTACEPAILVISGVIPSTFWQAICHTILEPEWEAVANKERNHNMADGYNT